MDLYGRRMVVRPFELTHGPEVLEGQAHHPEPVEGESRTPPDLKMKGPGALDPPAFLFVDRRLGSECGVRATGFDSRNLSYFVTLPTRG